MAAKKLSPNLKLAVLAGVFLLAFFVPFGQTRVSQAVNEAFLMLGEYARQHVLLCLVPAFFIAGAIMVFLNQQAVMKYLGPKANKIVAYSVASFSGAILAVCSCTVLPLFKGIYKKGAGLGPAVSFLYSGPAINILAIVLTAKVLGFKIGLARAVGAIVFAFVIGLLMHLIFRKEDEKRQTDAAMFQYDGGDMPRTLGQNALYMLSMIGILVFVNWAPSRGSLAVWDFIYRYKYSITGAFALLLVFALLRWFKKPELKDWVMATRDFAIQILPLLFGGVLVSGFLLGAPRPPGPHPGGMGHPPLGRQFPGGQLDRLVRRGPDVLRHPHRGAHPAGTARRGHGPGPGPGAAPGRPFPVAAVDPGHRGRAGFQEDLCLRGLGGGVLHPGRSGIRADRLRGGSNCRKHWYGRESAGSALLSRQPAKTPSMFTLKLKAIARDPALGRGFASDRWVSGNCRRL